MAQDLCGSLDSYLEIVKMDFAAMCFNLDMTTITRLILIRQLHDCYMCRWHDGDWHDSTTLLDILRIC